uniref:Uncharacterized protein n=1 Tax=Ornithorhynchus anatinus TaxID=9258 RepID=A0A6I8N5D5_ORNAN
MSISPQGTYLSKIIPNAVLPPTVDVVALSRCSVRTRAAAAWSPARPPSTPSPASPPWALQPPGLLLQRQLEPLAVDGDHRVRRLDPLLSRGSEAGARGRPGSAGEAEEGAEEAGARSGGALCGGSQVRGRPRLQCRRRSGWLRHGQHPERPLLSPERVLAQAEARARPAPPDLLPVPAGRLARRGPGAVPQVRAEGPAAAEGPDGGGGCRGDGPPRPWLVPCRLPAPPGSPAHPVPFQRLLQPERHPTLPLKLLAAPGASPGKRRPQPQKPERVCSLQSPGPSVSSSLTSLSSSSSDPAPPDGGTSSAPTGPPRVSASPASQFVIPPHPKVPAPFSASFQAQGLRSGSNSSGGPGLRPRPVPTPRGSPAPGRATGLPRRPPRVRPPALPPPSHHPPPPPSRKTEGEAAGPPAAPQEVNGEMSQDPSWPPPPPPAPDEQDLTMADFPPPDEAYFSTLPLPPAEGPGPTVPEPPAAPEPGAASRSLSATVSSPAGGPRAEPGREAGGRGRGGPAPKEDAGPPVVTPSLLQMVRLRSVAVEGQAAPPSAPGQGQAAPQKPLRKALSVRGCPPSRDPVPSHPLHAAVRLEASGLPPDEGPRANGRPTEAEASPPPKSQATTASFIFAKGAKKPPAQSPASPQAPADLQRHLVAELRNFSERRPSPQKQPGKAAPPVARKPSAGAPRASPQASPPNGHRPPGEVRTRPQVAENGDAVQPGGPPVPDKWKRAA